MSVSKGSACMCHVTEGSLCSLRGCFIHREHSFLDASHAAFVESSTMWRPDRERVAVTHHVSHACDTAKVPVGSMHCPCTAGGCCSRVSVIRCHRLLPLLTSGVFQFYGTTPRCQSPMSWRMHVPCDWTAMQPSWSFIMAIHCRDF